MFARGNDFNLRGSLRYDYNKINLIDGKRLDSYIPGEAIISRKATDLNQIKLSTFESYLKELTTKYRRGKVIRSNKYMKKPKNIDGQLLDGKYFLEIPSSNKFFYESSSEHQRLSELYDVTIKYLDE